MVNITPILPMLLPLATLLWVRTTDHSVSISRNNWFQEYDYIVVGGGSAGAVLASRLSEVSNWNILLLEAGGSESLLSDIPIAAATLQMTPIDWAYQTEPQEASCFGLINRRSRWPRGRVLGGSSVLNYMLYIRGNARDYDKWENLGAIGWTWADVFPYFVKSEDNRDPSVAFNGYHGTGGPLTVSSPPDATPLATTFAVAGKYLGYPNSDLNGPLQSAFAIPQGTIRRGARCSTSKAFLKPARGRKNLHVLTFAYATRILFTANKKAVGVQFDRFSMSYTVFARREIILSAGSINTAQLLMLSGVGPADHLRSMKIPVVANLPVGNNLQDHIYPGVHFTVDAKVSLIQRRVVNLPNILKYFASGRGPLTALGGVEGLAFIKTKYVNRSDDYPDFQIHMLSGGPTSDDGQTFRRVQGISRELWAQYYRPFLPYDSFSLYPVLLRPKSRGFVRLRSRNPYDPPVIDPRYLTHPNDIVTMVDAMKICIAVGLTPGFRRMNSRLFDAVVPGCEIYRIWSDEYLACMARTYTSTIYHPVGTARMGLPSDPRSVVDPNLRVLGGISNLRIADGSVMPDIISGNTNAPIIMIAERLSDMIKGKRLPRIRPPVAGQTTPVYIKRSSTNDTYSGEEYMPNTNYDFVNQIMKKLKTNNAKDILHSHLEDAMSQPQEMLYASASTEKVSRRLSPEQSQMFGYSTLAGTTKRGSSKYLSLKERFTPLINKFGKQRRAVAMMNKLQNLVHNYSNVTTYSFKSIEKKYPEIGQFNNYYEHLLEGQNYDDKEMQSILLNLEKLLMQDKVNHQLHNTIFNNEFNHTNDELLEAISSFNILNAS